MRLADIAGNAVMGRFLEDLIARTSLIIGLYGSTRGPSCSESEHTGLVDALAARDSERAAELMDHHLRHIEEALDIRERVSEPTDVRRIFSA
jgi:DNA-binding GntR family transcriptional regulator